VNPGSRVLKLRILHKLPTPYTDSLFANLAHRADVDLEVHYLWRSAATRPWRSQFGAGHTSRDMRPLLKIADVPLTWRALRERDAVFLVNDWGHLPSLIVILARLIARAPVALWTDVPNQDANARSRLKNWARGFILSRLLPRLNLVFGSGPEAVRALLDMGVSPRRVRDLPFSVDVPSSLPSRTREETLTLLFVGQIVHRKGVDTALRAFSQALKQTERPIRFRIVGDGPDRRLCEEMSARLGLEPYLEWCGWLEPHRVKEAYRRSDVYVHLARWEPYGVSIIEALANGLPVIGTPRAGAVPDRVWHERNGLVVPPEDCVAAADAIVQLAALPESEFQEMRHQAWTAAQRCRHENVAQILVDAAGPLMSE
jgi:glycosyltransferase involved in cell wall biosynthesis